MPGTLYKSTTENMSFFNREQIAIVRKVYKEEGLTIIGFQKQTTVQ